MIIGIKSSEFRSCKLQSVERSAAGASLYDTGSVDDTVITADLLINMQTIRLKNVY